MDNITRSIKVIEDGLKLLPDDAKAEWKASASDIFINEAIKNAVKALDEPTGPETTETHLEKIAMLDAYSVQEANRMATTLWRLELLTDEIEKEYRKLPSMADVVGPYNIFLTNRQARMDELASQGEQIQTEKREMEIFMGILNGVPAEESEKRYEDFKKQQQAAMAGGR